MSTIYRHKTIRAREQSRSMVMTQYGIVATSQAVASQAGAAILARGGSAVDAAIAANAALGVIEPMMNGVGGDLFAIVYDAKTKKLYGLNASGWAPKGMTIESLKAKGVVDEIPAHGHRFRDRAGRGGGMGCAAAALWQACDGGRCGAGRGAGGERHRGAGDGCGKLAHLWASFCARAPALRASFCRMARRRRRARSFAIPSWRQTLRRIGEHGRDGFYKGPTAEAMLKLSREQHGFLEADDLADFQPEWVEPVSTTYHGWTVWEMPPNGQGIAALSMLNIMERFPIAEWGHNSQKSLHVEIEAQKLAYADLQHYIGDPHASHIPVEQLISKQLAAKRATQITEHAQCNVLPSELKPADGAALERHDLSCGRGSRGQRGFADPEQFRSVRQRAGGGGNGLRAAESRRRIHAEAGTAEYAASAHASAAHDHSRVHAEGRSADRVRHHGRLQPGPGACAVRLEHCGLSDEYSGRARGRALPETGLRGLQGRDREWRGAGSDRRLRRQGHEITVELRYSQTMGRGNAVEHHDSTGVNYGATDPRADGEAVPEQMPFSP